MHELILASGAGSSLVVTITIIVDTSAQVCSGLTRLILILILIGCAQVGP